MPKIRLRLGPLASERDKIIAFQEIQSAINKLLDLADTGELVDTVELDWEGISGKPDTFPPSEHNHDARYYTKSQIDAALAEESDSAEAVWTEDTILSGSRIRSKLSIKSPSDVLLSGTVFEARVLVSDAADSYEPSLTATLEAGAEGTLVAGEGTGQVVVQTASGELSIEVVEALNSVHRYLWVVVAGNSRGLFAARLGPHELIFT